MRINKLTAEELDELTARTQALTTKECLCSYLERNFANIWDAKDACLPCHFAHKHSIEWCHHCHPNNVEARQMREETQIRRQEAYAETQAYRRGVNR